MSAKVKDAAPLRIQHNQITGCIGSKVSCGFYRRKPPTQGINEFAVAIFGPNFQLQGKTSQRENVLSGDGQPQEMRRLSGIRGFERGDLRAIAGKLQNSSACRVADIDSVTVRHCGKWMRDLLSSIGQDPPNS